MIFIFIIFICIGILSAVFGFFILFSPNVFLIAVPTPFKRDYDPDLKYDESATRMIIPKLRDGNLSIS